MGAFAAVMTGRGAGAIATIQLFGESAPVILQQVFRPTGRAALEWVVGSIVLGHIIDAEGTVDQVTIGCEAPDTCAIHCHGNPLIVERIVALLQRYGVALVPPRELLANMLAAHWPCDAIAVEAKLALARVKTVEGAKVIACQMQAGLAEKVGRWRRLAESGDLGRIVAEAGEVLRRSEPVRLVLSGCTIALIGPANTGKSTLLNVLAGRDKALVTDVRGTTRDWLLAEIHIPPLAATVIDTAGLDAELTAAANHDVDNMAQAATMEILNDSDVVLLVLDGSETARRLDSHLIETLSEKKLVTVLNKSDLPHRLDPACLAGPLQPVVRVSAKYETGITDLVHAIHRVCNVTGFTPHTPVAFTPRQRALIERLAAVTCLDRALVYIKELLRGAVQG